MQLTGLYEGIKEGELVQGVGLSGLNALVNNKVESGGNTTITLSAPSQTSTASGDYTFDNYFISEFQVLRRNWSTYCALFGNF